jgi:hypothetical protein
VAAFVHQHPEMRGLLAAPFVLLAMCAPSPRDSLDSSDPPRPSASSVPPPPSDEDAATPVDAADPPRDAATRSDVDRPVPDAGPSDAARAPDASDPLADLRRLCVQKINGYRATVSLPPLAHWQSGDTCGDREAKSDSETGTGHGAFGLCGETAQNECPNWPGAPADIVAQCLQLMWDEGPEGGHYQNMTTTVRTQVACGFYQTPRGRWWLVQNFR